MYKRHNGQISLFDEPEFFGTIPLNPKNEWVRLGKLIPWMEFEERYAENFKSATGQPAISGRMALASVLIKQRYKSSDDDVVAEIAMNPYLQHFLGLQQFQYEAPFSASAMSRFRQRITPEMLAWVNDYIAGRPEEKDDDSDDDPSGTSKTEDTENDGTLILDATCAPQNIRFPTDVSLLNEARLNTEEIIDELHDLGAFGSKKPRTYRQKAKNQYNSFSKARKKSKKMVRKATRQQLGYLKRNLETITIGKQFREKLPAKLQERLSVVEKLFAQQKEMFETGTHRIDERIVSLSQSWVRPIVRGKQNAPVEFGAKVEMSVVNGYLRIEDLRWDAFNESTTLQTSVESYRKSYGHYPARVLADTIFRTRENLRYCKEHNIHINGPRLGKRPTDLALYRKQLREEWLESGERGEIERQFGVAKRRYSLGSIAMKLKHTSEVDIYASVLALNLWKKLRLLFAQIYNFLFVPLFPVTF